MKKILSLILVALLILPVLSLAGCGSINKSEVSILWSGDGQVKVPNSLINSMERAMYIENIDYVHYGANLDSNKQLEQAKEVLNKGCAVLVVELVSHLFTQEIVNAAKEKNVPVIFFNCSVEESVVNSYDKCIVVSSDLNTVADVQGTMIADYIKANFMDLDKNKDGKISYASYDTGIISIAAVKKANELLATKDYRVSNKKFTTKKINTSIELYDLENVMLEFLVNGEIQDAILENVELILTENDNIAFAVLLALQAKDYNTDKLKTQSIPMFTLDNTVDYKEYVLANRPEIDTDLLIKDTDSEKIIKQKNKEIKKIKELQSYYEQNAFLVDLTAVNESDLAEMIYTTINVIDTGRIAGTVIADDDTIAVSVAKIVKNLIKGKDMFLKVASKVKDDEPAKVTVEERVVKVRYTVYAQ